MAHAQFARGNYHNRFDVNGKWFTMSTNQSLEPLADKLYSDPFVDWATIKRKLPNYNLDEFDDCIRKGLVETNVAILEKICARLDIKTEIVMDYPTELSSSKRLLQLCLDCKATEYLSGPSGRKYLDVALFEKHGIAVKFQELSSPRPAIDLLREIDSCKNFATG